MSKPVLLFVAAQADGHPRVNIDEEEKLIKKALDSPDAPVSLRRETACTYEDLLEALEDGPEVLHIACHGEGGNIIFADGPVQLDHLVEELTAHPSLKIFITTACESAALARRLSTLQAAIGMRGEISSEAACAFTKGFYRSFARGKSPAVCHASGVRALSRGFEEEAEFPRLYPEFIDAPGASPTVEPLDPGHPAPELSAELAAVLAQPDDPAFDALLAGRGKIAGRLTMSAVEFLRMLVTLVQVRPNLREAAKTLAQHWLPHAADWAEFDAAYQRGAADGEPHVTLPFANDPICELVAARIGKRRAYSEQPISPAQFTLPAVASLPTLDVPEVSGALAETFLLKESLKVPEDPKTRLAAVNAKLKALRMAGDRQGRRYRVHLVFGDARPGAVTLLRTQLEELLLIRGTASNIDVTIAHLLDLLFEWNC